MSRIGVIHPSQVSIRCLLNTDTEVALVAYSWRVGLPNDCPVSVRETKPRFVCWMVEMGESAVPSQLKNPETQQNIVCCFR